ncbi:Molybdopterin dependent oxidoreductase [Granulibacter bethesdensis]|uniref:Protein-methionine-sulfoxide reductase catalytic subunit MsrP n=2 Tax=Granulibacter bethesdensis TaxID=364410 RepID=A0AAN0VFR1_9PROT|nr:Molybdopterin dependent oxidoreductase [Granulibacter bethesdensis]
MMQVINAITITTMRPAHRRIAISYESIEFHPVNMTAKIVQKLNGTISATQHVQDRIRDPMFITVRPDWAISEASVSPEKNRLSRRSLLRAALTVPVLSTTVYGGPSYAAGSSPASKTDIPSAGRPLSAEKDVLSYNNFYEFGSTKDIVSAAQAMQLHPWSLTIDGMVGKPRTIAFEDLLGKMKVEERIYRHRCVEAWSMTVPWMGFPLADLIALAEPLSGARYVVFKTRMEPDQMPGLAQIWYPWPYTEGLAMDEATHPLAFIATGLYGKPLSPQNGAPLRLVVPWKYGFKSAKSLASISFTDQRPKTFWEQTGPREYGFWANVNPDVSHPRWSQASERLIGSDERVPTLLYNGYAEQVASLYTGRSREKLFM